MWQLLITFVVLFFSGIDLDTVNIIQRDALLLFRTLCKVGSLDNFCLVRTNKKVTFASFLPFVVLTDEHERRKR